MSAQYSILYHTPHSQYFTQLHTKTYLSTTAQRKNVHRTTPAKHSIPPQPSTHIQFTPPPIIHEARSHPYSALRYRTADYIETKKTTPHINIQNILPPHTAYQHIEHPTTTPHHTTTIMYKHHIISPHHSTSQHTNLHQFTYRTN